VGVPSTALGFANLLINLKIKIMWKEENNQLKRSFEFKDFVVAFTFMTQVAFAAEKMNHHPNWSNVFNKVEIALFTHDAKDSITEKDRKLSKEIDMIYKS
jgi:4a-hydroxytetrahydrobiopterin dehydratase